MCYSHPNHSASPGAQLKALFSRLEREVPIKHDVALILRMCVKRGRGVPRKQKFDEREAAVDGLAWYTNDRKCPFPSSWETERAGHGVGEGRGSLARP